MTTASTRERILKSAHDLFYRDGFHSVGLDRILDEVGVTKTTFYNHFPSKDDLVLASLRWHDRWWRDTFRDLLRKHGGDTARGQLLAIFDALEEVFQSDGFNGCIFINVAVEFPMRHDPAHVAAAEHKRAVEALIREIGAFAGADDPDALAQEITLVMEGSYVTRQVSGSAAVAAVGKRLVESIVERRVDGCARAGKDAGVRAEGERL